MTTNSIFYIQYSARRGFTLVETLVAIAILLIAVVGPISLIGDALHKLYYAKDQMIAINLAQEGIEVVRQKRDSNMLDGVVAWDAGISVGNYTISSHAQTITTTTETTPQTVNINTDGFYTQSSGTATQFKRIVAIAEVVNDRENKVTSTVTWMTGGQAGTITVTEYLFKWAIP